MYKFRIHPSSLQLRARGRAAPHKARPQEGRHTHPSSGPRRFRFPPVRWVTPTELRMVECPLDVLRWAEELYRVDARWVLSYRPLPFGNMR